MLKQLYLSTREGHYMYHVLARVDRSFRLLFRAVQDKELSHENYKKLLFGWEHFVSEYDEFLESIPALYGTNHTAKVAEKKYKIILKELRMSGQKKSISLNSPLGKNLFTATKSTEMCFKILKEHLNEGDVSLDAYLNIYNAFEGRKKHIKAALKRLDTLTEKVASRAALIGRN